MSTNTLDEFALCPVQEEALSEYKLGVEQDSHPDHEQFLQANPWMAECGLDDIDQYYLLQLEEYSALWMEEGKPDHRAFLDAHYAVTEADLHLVDVAYIMEEYDDLRNAGNKPNIAAFLRQHPEVTKEDIDRSNYLYDLFHGEEVVAVKGGPGSGNFGHSGRPGEGRGGSGPSNAAVETSLQSGTVKSARTLGGGRNESMIIVLEDGTKAVFKPQNGENGLLRHDIRGGTYWRREAATYDVAKVLGVDDLVPVTIQKETEIAGELRRGSCQEFCPDSETPISLSEKAPTLSAGEMPTGIVIPKEAYDGEKDGVRAAAFDFLIGNLDRNLGNWMIQSGEKIKLIDNGLSFPTDHSDETLSCLSSTNGIAERYKDTQFPPEVQEWKDKLPEIEVAMRKNGLEDDAIWRMYDRHAILMKAKTYKDAVSQLKNKAMGLLW